MPLPDAVPSRAPLGECRAVIDIGTNSVKLLVGRVDGESVEPILEKGNQTRLGEGFFRTGLLQSEAIARTADAVARFRTEAMAYHPGRLRVIATAAAREAVNRDEFLHALRPAAAAEIEVISGQEEAELAFRGVCTQPGLTRDPVLVADVGGGSTELILGTDGRRQFSRSFPLGAVRLMESLRIDEPPTSDNLARCRRFLADFMAREVAQELGPVLPRSGNAPLAFVGVGGTAAVLACIQHGLSRYDRERIESTQFTYGMVNTMTERLWKLPLEDRRRIPGLPPERADVILTGVAIYEALMLGLHLDCLKPSTRGLRFAALLDPR